MTDLEHFNTPHLWPDWLALCRFALQVSKLTQLCTQLFQSISELPASRPYLSVSSQDLIRTAVHKFNTPDMGKTKGKSLKPGAFDIQHDLFSDLIAAAGNGSPLKAADGHNVDGWADEDIRTYNELLNERAKLEREKTELEQKSSRHQTQRALLDEHATALDSLFKPQLSGDFKFTGHRTCCLDADTDNKCVGEAPGRGFQCKHEVCKRAKTKGVSWMEMDTIKYYHARIMAEKSQRMQKALRKQRDVELVRVKKDDEEEFALRSRKSTTLDKAARPSINGSQPGKSDKGSPLDQSSLHLLASKDFLLDPRNSAILEAAKENEHIVRRIRARLDKIRHDVNAGRVSPADARVKLDQANSEMAEAERKNNEFRQMILDAEPTLPHIQQQPPNSASLSNVLSKTLASSNADAFSQALTVMKGFFSASDPHDVQTAITDLRSVLELNGPMSPVLQKSFQALEEMLAKPNAKGFTVDVTTADGKTRTCNNVVEVMMNLRLKMEGKDPHSMISDTDLNMDRATIQANQECNKVEELARKEMAKMIEKMENEPDEKVMKALTIIKTRAVLKSPIPPLTDIVIDGSISILILERSLNALILEARKGASLVELSGKLTKIVIEGAQKKPEKYLDALKLVNETVLQLSKAPQTLLDACSKVETQMSKFVAAHEEKKKKAATQTASLNRASSHCSPSQDAASRGKERGNLTTEEILMNLPRLFGPGGKLSDPGLFRESMSLHYRMFLEVGPWEMFRVFATKHVEPRFAFEPWDWEMEFYQANMGIPFPTTQQCLDVIVDYQSRGICPGQTALVIAQRLTHQIRTDFEGAKSNLKILKSILTHHEWGSSRDWFHTFNFIGQAIIDLFFILAAEIATWNKQDASIMAMDVVGMACTFSLGASSQVQGYRNLKVIDSFMASVLVNTDKVNNAKNLDRLGDVMGRFYHMCDDTRHLCNFQHACRAQVQLENKEKFVATFPMPPEVEESRKIQMNARSWSPDMFRATQRQTSDPLPLPTDDVIKGGKPLVDVIADSYLLQALDIQSEINHLEPKCYTTNPLGSQLRQAIATYNGKLQRDLDLYYEDKGDERRLLLLSIQSHLKDLKSIHTVLSNDPLAVDILTTPRFLEILEEATSKQIAPVRQKVSLKHVSRKSPSMVKSPLNVTSKSGNVQEGMNKDLARHASPGVLEREGRSLPTRLASSDRPRHLTSASRRSQLSSIRALLPDLANPQSSSPQPTQTKPTTTLPVHSHPKPASKPATKPTSTKPVLNPFSIMSQSTSPTTEPVLSPPEEKIKQQLTTFLKGVLDIDTDAAEMPESVHKDVFQGVANHLQNMARGHIEMAWVVANGRDYTGLQAWLKARFPEACGGVAPAVSNATPSPTTAAAAMTAAPSTTANEAQIGATSTDDNDKVPNEGASAGKPVKTTPGPGGRRRKGRKH